jgi:hypothetical protein
MAPEVDREQDKKELEQLLGYWAFRIERTKTADEVSFTKSLKFEF